MAGIINNLMANTEEQKQNLIDPQNADASKITTATAATQAAPVGGYSPEKVTLDPSESVEGRVASIAAKDSPLNTLARTNADKAMNRRGLINSSMAVGAGEKAVLEAATPIAQSDAQLSLSAKQGNQNAQNQMLSQKLSGEQNIQQIEKQGSVNSDLNFQNFTYESNLQQLRGEQAKQLSEIETRASQIGQATQSMALMSSSFNTAIAEILANQDMTPEIKQEHVNKQIELYRAQVNIMGSMANLPLAQYLDFSLAGGSGAPPQNGGGNTPTTPTTTIPASNGSPTSYQNFVSAHLKAAGGQPSEALIKTVLDEAARTSMDSSKVYTVLRPLYPNVPQQDFEMELNNRGYSIVDGKITAPTQQQDQASQGGTGGTAGAGGNQNTGGQGGQNFEDFAAATLGGGTTEASITATLNKARELGANAQQIYNAMSPYFPGISFEQFLNELAAREYYDLVGADL